jgi:aspartyl-tRNA(Asn)/glutamyl-tRNA(Gln) amidotransferase subunit C
MISLYNGNAMKVDRELVSQVARLANIELTESDIELFTTQLASIVDYMEKLNEVKEDAEPFAFQDFLTLPLREDVVIPSLPVDEVMKNAPSQKKNLFRVPRIIP